MLRFRNCRVATSNADAQHDFLFGESVFQSELSGFGSGDRFGIKAVEKKRAEAERQKQEAAAKAAVEKQQNEQVAAQTADLLAKIHQLNASGDLKLTYETISSLRDEISSLPRDVGSKLLDELQIASAPVDRRRMAVLGDLQHKVMEGGKLPDSEDKLRLLDKLADEVKAVPGSDAGALAGMVDTMRTTTRTNLSDAANTPNAATIAERDQLKALADKEHAQQQAANEAAAALKAQQDKLRADAAQSTENFGTMIAIFSVAKVCAQNNIIFDSTKVEALKNFIKQYINSHKIDGDQVNKMWTATRQGMMTTPVRESDCAGSGNNINAVFGPTVFGGNVEKNPF
jgi:hypothetical protein